MSRITTLLLFTLALISLPAYCENVFQNEPDIFADEASEEYSDNGDVSFAPRKASLPSPFGGPMPAIVLDGMKDTANRFLNRGDEVPAPELPLD